VDADKKAVEHIAVGLSVVILGNHGPDADVAVRFVGRTLPEIAPDTARPRGGAHGAVADSLLVGKDAHVPQPCLGDGVCGDHVVEGSEFLLVVLHHPLYRLSELGGNIPPDAAHGGHTVVHPVSGKDFENVHDLFPEGHAQVEGGVEPDGVARYACPEHMGVKPFQFKNKGADVLSPRRHGDRSRIFHGPQERDDVAERADAADALRKIDNLDRVAVPGHELDSSVDCSGADRGAHDLFALEVQPGGNGFFQADMHRTYGNCIFFLHDFPS